MSGGDYPEFQQYAEHLLRRHEFTARAQVSRMLIESSTDIRTWADPTMDRLVVELRKGIYAHETKTEDQIVPWSATRTVKPTTGHRRRSIVVACLLAAFAVAVPHPITYVCTILAAVLIALSETQCIRVEGNTILRGRYWNGFPESTVRYPDEFGPIVRFATWDTPTQKETERTHE